MTPAEIARHRQTAIEHLVRDAQTRLSLHEYRAPALSVAMASVLAVLGLFLFTVLLTYASGPSSTDVQTPGSGWTPGTFAAAYLRSETGAVIPIGFLAALWVAGSYLHWRQGRETVFKMVEELLGPDLEQARYDLQVRLSKAPLPGNQAVAGWFVYPGPGLSAPAGAARFREDHALSKLVFFIHRLRLYHQDGLIDAALMRRMFHGFFAQYELPLLEFAASMRAFVKLHPVMDDRWLDMAESIECFYALTGCSGVLPKGHAFTYFTPGTD